MSGVHASFTVDLATKKYSDGLTRIQNQTKATATRMVADMDATAKATERLGTGVDQARRRMANFGQVSHQLQDISIQMQSGTKFATIFAQQGSQLASILGPQGAILGAVIAIGAGVYSWVTNAKAANAAFEEGEKRLKSMQGAGEQLRSGAIADTQAAGMAGMKGSRLAMAKLELEHEKEMYEIRQRGAINGDAAMQKMAENAELVRFEGEKAAILEEEKVAIATRYAEQAREVQSIQERGRNADRERAEMALTDAEKLARVEMGIAAIHKRTKADTVQSHGNKVREATSIANLAEKELEAAKLRAKIQEDHAKSARSLLEDSIKAADKIAETQRKVGELQDQLGKEQQKQAINRQAASGQSVIDSASEFLKPQSQRIAERESGQAERRAINREISRRIDRADQHRRAIGADGIDPEERANLRENERRNVKAAQNKDKILASIDKDSITELTTAIKDLQAELIAK